MATAPLYSAETPTTNVSYSGGTATHLMVLTDSATLVLTKPDTDTVSLGSVPAGSVIKLDHTKITFTGGTFRALFVT
jgi:hypothetical protein